MASITNDNKQFFIVGSQRSGSTLLKLILDSHPDIIVYEESESYKKLENNDYPQDRVVGFKIPIWTSRISWLKKEYPNAKYIFLKRDLRAIACSMLTLKKEGQIWIQRNGLFDLECSIKDLDNPKDKTFFSKKLENLKSLNDWISISVLCAFVKCYYFLEEYRRFSLNVLELEYETLVTNPDEEIKNILAFLCIRWNDNVLKHHKLNKGIWGGTNFQRKIDINSINKWKSFFDDKNLEKIEKLIKELKKTIEY